MLRVVGRGAGRRAGAFFKKRVLHQKIYNSAFVKKSCYKVFDVEKVWLKNVEKVFNTSQHCRKVSFENYTIPRFECVKRQKTG